MSKLGLIGKQISYSFSKLYFTEKFKNENLPFEYKNFDINTITEFPNILKTNKDFAGLNVTIPYKEQVIPYLDSISDKARKIGAVNTIKISKSGKLKGYNTDWYGFKKSIKPFLKPHHTRALILGTGGASKAIAYALKNMKIKFDFVSRTKNENAKFLYSELTDTIINSYPIIINSTPIGTHPNIDECPNIPYHGITSLHLLYDLVYNPSETKFLNRGKNKGATICNGSDMLKYQAEKAWKIWKLY